MTRHTSARARVIVSVLVVSLLASGIVGSMAAPVVEANVLLQGSTTVAISPSPLELECGETAKVDIRINDVVGLYGVDVKVSYDHNVLAVDDANDTMPGTQVQQGDFPDVRSNMGWVEENSVDVGSGTISYAAIRIDPAQPQDGSGIVASITFRGLAAGTSPVSFASVMLADKDARSIQAEQVGGEIRVTCTNPPAPTATTPPDDPDPDPDPPAGDQCVHAVRPGETLNGIARLYGVLVSDVLAANTIANPNMIYVGQQLVIPGCTNAPVDPPAGDCYAHTVQMGETLYGIAVGAGDSVAAAAQRNSIINPHLIRVGQVLTICPGGGGTGGPGTTPGCSLMYTVAPYDTLYRIAVVHGSNVPVLVSANQLINPNLIYPGQMLCIP